MSEASVLGMTESLPHEQSDCVGHGRRVLDLAQMNSVKQCRRASPGFTLIELVTVVVVISIIAALGTTFIINTANSYQQAAARVVLAQTGRQAIEQITRRIRVAVPNSIRVSGNNMCIEWLPVVAGANYVGILPDQSNGAPAINSIDTAPVDFDLGTPRYVVVAPLVSGEVYTAATATLALYGSVNTGAVPNIVNLSAAKQFLRNSVNKRLFVADHPNQFCVDNGDLTFHENYTTAGNYPSAASLTGSPPNAGVLIAQGVAVGSEIPFAIEVGTEVRNAVVTLQMPFANRGEKIVLEHEVMVRNVP